MKEQRRHQRIRFNSPPLVRLGQFGCHGKGALENLSLGGLMVRTDLLLKVGEAFGCEFVVLNSPLIDMSAVVVSKIGDLYGARFQAGPISEWLIQDAIDNALATGNASILSINELHGCKVMRIAGGFNASLHNDFMYNLTKTGIAQLDLSGVTEMDHAGLALCKIAIEQYKVEIVRPAACVLAALPDLADNLMKAKCM